MNKSLVNCVLLPVGSGHLLLPNTAVASMISYSKPAPVPDAPGWLLGMINWQGWYLPVASWPALLDPEHIASTDNARIAVIKNLHQHSDMPYFAIIAQGFPRLLSVSEEDLAEEDLGVEDLADIDQQTPDSTSEAGTECLLTRIQMHEHSVDVPALPALGAYISRHLQRSD